MTYKGRNCAAVGTGCPAVTPIPTTVSIWNWTTSAWVPLGPAAAVGTTDFTFSSLLPPGSPAAYIGTGAFKGQVRVRVFTQRTAPSVGAGPAFFTGGNLMKLTYDAP